MLNGRSAACTSSAFGTGAKSFLWSGSTMCSTELAMNTMTADTRTGTTSDVSPTNAHLRDAGMLGFPAPAMQDDSCAGGHQDRTGQGDPAQARNHIKRSEERRVGKECRSRWSPYH